MSCDPLLGPKTDVNEDTAEDTSPPEGQTTDRSIDVSSAGSSGVADDLGGSTSDASAEEGTSAGISEPCVAGEAGLRWPLACTPEDECWAGIGYPDVDGDGLAFDCGPPGYVGHEGTDLAITESAMLEGVAVLAAAAAEVVFVRDAKHDRCDIDPNHPDCMAPPEGWGVPGQTNGYRVCTEGAPEYCPVDSPYQWCFWCFDGGNVIILRHIDGGDTFATRYDHVRMGSAMVEEGDLVAAGDPIALVGSAGRSTGPHLHFEVWDQGGWYSLTEPWIGQCSPAGQSGDWFASDPPWCS